MIFSGRDVNRIVSIILYAGVAGLTLWGGTKLVNYSVDSKYYRDFLLHWEVAYRRFSAGDEMWPEFSGGNHMEYMENLSAAMSRSGIPLPSSNTNYFNIYQIDKMGQGRQDLFLLCLSDRIIIYGLSRKTFERIDSFIDGEIDQEHGAFLGYQGKDRKKQIGLWQL